MRLDAKKQAGGVANEVSDAASQVADAATDAARKTASSFEKALRDTIENQPYTTFLKPSAKLQLSRGGSPDASRIIRNAMTP